MQVGNVCADLHLLHRRLWTDGDNLKLVREQYPWFLSTYNSFEQPILQADSVRYLYMHAFGGKPLLVDCPQCKDVKMGTRLGA